MTFPEKAFKGGFNAAHSSAMTASSTSLHRHLKNHNDYMTESWLNALFKRGCTVQVMEGGMRIEHFLFKPGEWHLKEWDSIFSDKPAVEWKTNSRIEYHSILCPLDTTDCLTWTPDFKEEVEMSIRVTGQVGAALWIPYKWWVNKLRFSEWVNCFLFS